MLFEELIQRFKEERNHAHLHANELLDYIQNKYIHREITIVEYKRLYSELDKLQAEKPKSYMINVFS